MFGNDDMFEQLDVDAYNAKPYQNVFGAPQTFKTQVCNLGEPYISFFDVLVFE